ncbi:hypothetical protein BRARA_C01055 [Brassica rapa]|uniref:Uncharacterized protein n=1 Tax=Brassica campestris TaxID=3711 RepID=A0A397ZVB0_BRACM|nr:hypothetical protein BRARA_C01055 [Brassica rapa]
MEITTDSRDDRPDIAIGSKCDQGSNRQPDHEISKLPHLEQCKMDSSTNIDKKAIPSGVPCTRPEWDWRSDLQSQMQVSSKLDAEDNISSFESQRHYREEGVTHSRFLSSSSSSILDSNHLASRASLPCELLGVNSSNLRFPSDRGSDRLHLQNGFGEKSMFNVDHSLFANEGRNKDSSAEDEVISNILSLDFDPWDETLTSPQNWAELLGRVDQRSSPLKPSNLLKQQNSQSRFSFAQESSNRAFDRDNHSIYGQFSREQPIPESVVSRDIYRDNLGNLNGFASNYSGGLEHVTASPLFSSYKTPVTRPQVSAPPGFSAPSRLPPPGFSSHERMGLSSDTAPGTRFLDSAAMLRNAYQVPPPVGNSIGASDIEFADPAILAVGRGMINADLDMSSGFSSQMNSFGNETGLQMLRQQSLSAAQQQVNGFHHDLRNSSPSPIDPYRFNSRLMDQQAQGSSLSLFSQHPRQQQPSANQALSNGHWDKWNEGQNLNSLGMAELLRNERLGFNGSLYNNGYEDPKFRIPSPGDVYNRTYGIPSGKEENQKAVDKSKLRVLKPLQHNVVVGSGSKRTTSPDRDSPSNRLSSSTDSSYDGRDIDKPLAAVNSSDDSEDGVEDGPTVGNLRVTVTQDGPTVGNLSVGVSQMEMTANSRDNRPDIAISSECDQDSNRQSDHEVSKLPELEQCKMDSSINTDEESFPSETGVPCTRPEWDWRLDLQSQIKVDSKLDVEDMSSFDSQRHHREEDVTHSRFLSSSSLPSEASGVNGSNLRFPSDRGSDRLHLQNGFGEKSMFNVDHSLFANEGKNKVRSAEDEIISNILSLDFDPWDESLTSPHNLAELLGKVDQRSSPVKPSNLLKQHNSQSRFSFAQESTVSRPQVSAPPGFSAPSRLPPPGFSSHERVGLSSDTAPGTRFLDSAAMLRNTYQVQPPVGNPSGASDIEFADPAILAVGRGMVNADLDMRSSFSSQMNSFGNETGLQMLRHQSMSAAQQEVNGFHHDLRNLSPSLAETYGFSSRLMDHQAHGSNLSLFSQHPRQQPSANPVLSNGHWDKWNEGQSVNSLGMAELLRNERLGFNGSLYNNGYEEPNFRIPSPGDVYKRTYGM